jgi:hypothetical protein
MFLNNSALLFGPAAKLLGHLFGGKLSWERRLQRLRIKCEWSLNVLNVVSDRSWVGDQMVMLRLHCALIFFQIGCNTFNSGSAAKAKLFILNRVHNT